MKIVNVVCAAGRTGFYFDDQRAIKQGAGHDGIFYIGNTVTEGFRSIRQAGESISVMLVLEDGQVKTNKEAIAVLNGDGDGSVAKAIADAQSDLQDDIDAKVSQTDYDAHLLAQAAIDEQQTGDIATNTANIATNAAAIAKKVSIVDTAGSYLVNFDASGNVSYAPISILDGQGNPIALTGDNTVKPQ